VDGISSKTRRKIKNELLLEREFLLEGESKRLVPQEVLSRKNNCEFRSKKALKIWIRIL
jgi:hypothetical protein